MWQPGSSSPFVPPGRAAYWMVLPHPGQVTLLVCWRTCQSSPERPHRHTRKCGLLTSWLILHPDLLVSRVRPVPCHIPVPLVSSHSAQGPLCCCRFHRCVNCTPQNDNFWLISQLCKEIKKMKSCKSPRIYRLGCF